MRLHPSLLVVAGVGLALLTACTKPDAAADSAKAATATNPPALSGALTTSLSPLSPTGDTLSDSLLIARADKGRILGKESGAIWVVMISDFQCPYCRQWHDASMASLKRDYVETGKVRLAYLNLPLPQHKFARAEAEAALCAGAQDNFWPFAEQLFARQVSLEKAATVQPVFDSLAGKLGLDMAEFGRCQRRQAIRSLVESDIQQATKAGVRSTPSFLVGDFLVEGAVPYPEFRKAIDTALVLARSAKGPR
jgi:protein-disulfide isomerase